MISYGRRVHIAGPVVGFVSLLILEVLSLGVLAVQIGLLVSIFSLDVLFFILVPGYTLSTLLFPRPGILERSFLSLGLSLGLFIGLQIIFRMVGIMDDGIVGIILTVFSVSVVTVKLGLHGRRIYFGEREI